MAALSPAPKFYATDENGDPLAGGLIYTYAAGTSTPLATFTSSTGGTENENPVELDAEGRADIWLPVGTPYKFTVNNSEDELQFTVDNILVSAGGPTLLTAVGGTANAITATASQKPLAYAAGQTFVFTPTASNTGAATINISSLGAKNIFCEGSACLGGEIVQSVPVEIVYDGTQFNIIGPSVSIPGIWTPTLTFATPGDLAVTYGTRVGGYIRRGKVMTYNFDVRTSAFTHATASGNLQLTGLPFASAGANQEWYGSLIWTGITKASYTQVSARITEGVMLIIFGASGSGQTIANVTAADMPTGGTVQLIGSVTCRIV
jgi:hypothetical protein